ncbi:MAG TPA: type II TA system antitoxin MqsA family protein [Flavisolibacter sp.]|nr:type II TA system antitoxin MqsA family protein [Flavisolibacter sp.]
MKKKIECPYCDGFANLKQEADELTYRKEVFKIIAHFYKCEKCKEEFTTTETDDISLTQVHNQYREKNNIPFPDEIAAIRRKYDLSASKMSEVLGLGANGYSNYENGEIPTPAYGNLISAAAQPPTFMNLLEKTKGHFSDNAFNKAKERVAYLIRTADEHTNLCSTLNVFNEPNNYTGYRKPEPAKIANLVTYYIQHSKPDFNDKLKLSKQLFFTDFMHYKYHGTSISGLSYRTIKYGPVPANYDNIFAYLENEQLISSQFLKLPNGSARETFLSEADFDKNLFTDQEKKTIEIIIERFATISSWDILDLSHEEKAWKDLGGKRELIGYQEYAFDLKAV